MQVVVGEPEPDEQHVPGDQQRLHQAGERRAVLAQAQVVLARQDDVAPPVGRRAAVQLEQPAVLGRLVRQDRERTASCASGELEKLVVVQGDVLADRQIREQSVRKGVVRHVQQLRHLVGEVRSALASDDDRGLVEQIHVAEAGGEVFIQARPAGELLQQAAPVGQASRSTDAGAGEQHEPSAAGELGEPLCLGRRSR